ncbi:Mu transposase C-terminal domain-containing protein [Nonomuraea sp. NPDC050547]|uniref:Mu transposase C-terminal domain-containing protein n=1 Tax=Nonomuraea sp. NPDC050547 TaxID=3364368 RepID=UPI0037AAD5D3
MQGRGGQRVEVRYMPHDDRFVEVYLEGRHLCTAHPAERLTPEQTEAFRAHTRAEARRLGAERRRATARARAELVPITETSAGSPPTESRIVPPTAAAAASARTRDDQLRRRASTSLLGLTDPTAPSGPGRTPRAAAPRSDDAPQED